MTTNIVVSIAHAHERRIDKARLEALGARESADKLIAQGKTKAAEYAMNHYMEAKKIQRERERKLNLLLGKSEAIDTKQPGGEVTNQYGEQLRVR